VITDPRDLKLPFKRIEEPANLVEPNVLSMTDGSDGMLLVPPSNEVTTRATKLEKTPNIANIPEFDRFVKDVEVEILLKAGNNISTDDIIPAGTRVLPYWSNIPKVAEFAFEGVDQGYAQRARAMRQAKKHHAIVAGNNYGQGSSRENAAVAPRFLGLQLVIARSFARIHWQNLVNFGVLPLTFVAPSDYDRMKLGDTIRISDLANALPANEEINGTVDGWREPVKLRHSLSPRQIEVLLAGGAINWLRERQQAAHLSGA